MLLVGTDLELKFYVSTQENAVGRHGLTTFIRRRDRDPPTISSYFDDLAISDGSPLTVVFEPIVTSVFREEPMALVPTKESLFALDDRSFFQIDSDDVGRVF